MNLGGKMYMCTHILALIMGTDFKTKTEMQRTGSMSLFLLFVVSQEGNPFQWQHVFIVVTHLVVIVLPHFNEFITVNQANEFTGVRSRVLRIR